MEMEPSPVPVCQCQTKGLLLWSSICVLSLCVLIPLLKVYYIFDLLNLAKTENCPLCYGQSMCQCFTRDNFKINWDHFWANLFNLCISRSRHVYFGSCDGSFVVVKKFTRPKIYIDLSFLNREDIIIPRMVNEVGKVLSKNAGQEIIQKFHFCPSFENLGLFFELAVNTSGNRLNIKEQYLNFFHMVQVNVEPLIQQIASTNNWATAELLGSCGELTVSKYCGDTLTWAFPYLNWMQRSAIAKQLLIFAFHSTLHHPNFAFYFTDMTPDNFAISSEGIVRLVDLEHVIVVDKHPRDQPNNWDSNHECYHDASENGFAFYPKEICSHKISDVNVYSICQGILSEHSNLLVNGLLYSPPQQAVSIRRLVQDCVSPSQGQSRFQIAQLIIQKLDDIK